jgi:16S rRNA (uracil1498-N3)-methyltransferase
MPLIHGPMPPAEWIARRGPADLTMIASLRAEARHMRSYFASYRSAHDAPPKDVGVWVGPEGDFSREEIEAILNAGALPISLGPLVLRAETAALYCLSVIQHELTS